MQIMRNCAIGMLPCENKQKNDLETDKLGQHNFILHLAANS